MRSINKKIDHLVFSLVINGLILLVLALDVLFFKYFVNVVVAAVIFVFSFIFIYAGYKIWSIKDEIEAHFKLK